MAKRFAAEAAPTPTARRTPMNPLTRQLTQLDRSPYEIRRSGFSREAFAFGLSPIADNTSGWSSRQLPTVANWHTRSTLPQKRDRLSNSPPDTGVFSRAKGCCRFING